MPTTDGIVATPTLVLLPGMDGTGHLFAPFLAELPADLPREVLSYPPERPLDYAALADQVTAELPGNGPLVLLGESFAGPLAIMLADQLTPRVRGIILSATFVQNPRPGLTPLLPLARRLPFGVVPLQILTALLFGPFARPELVNRLRAAREEVSPAVLTARLVAAAHVDVTTLLRQIRTPILYLRASRDRIVPDFCGDTIARLAPQTRIVTVEAAHALLQTAPRVAASTIKQFLHDIGVP